MNVTDTSTSLLTSNRSTTAQETDPATEEQTETGSGAAGTASGEPRQTSVVTAPKKASDATLRAEAPVPVLKAAEPPGERDGLAEARRAAEAAQATMMRDRLIADVTEVAHSSDRPTADTIHLRSTVEQAYADARAVTRPQSNPLEA